MNNINMEARVELPQKDLILISAAFPYGYGESFLMNEIRILSTLFNKIYIFPLTALPTIREIPLNVIVNPVLTTLPKETNLLFILKNFFLIIEVLLGEFISARNKWFFVRDIRNINNLLCQAIEKSSVLEKHLLINPQDIFYSYWMNEGALTFAVLKKRRIINDFIFRVHGYDLYEHRRPGGYMPFRTFNMKMVKFVFAASYEGFQYLKKRTSYSNKVKLGYLGVSDCGLNPFDKSALSTVVSCSNLIDLKRVDLIIETLKKVSIPLRWVHFGSGPLRKFLMLKAKELPSNIDFLYKGEVDNDEILDFYKTTSVSLFIHLSESEGGVPVVLQEAASFGIPLISADAGGVKEIVNENTGVLLPLDFDVNEVAFYINNLNRSQFTEISFRKNIKEFWMEKFHAGKNYNSFFQQITA